MRGKPWTDEDMGRVLDTMDSPAREVAITLGRTLDAIYKARGAVRAGWTRRRETWTAAEDAIVLEPTLSLTARQIATRLPGRTLEAVKHRRRTLGAPPSPSGVSYSPLSPGHRRILARTCVQCGNLLPGDRFYTRKRGRVGHWITECAFCISERRNKHRAEYSRPRLGEKAEVMDRWRKFTTELTSRTATRSGEPYLEEDFKVLSDPRMSLLDKALKLNRTYMAVAGMCSRNGYQSSANKASGSRVDAAWRIDNPNVDRIEEITAALKQEFESAGVKFPEWDWGDEDLKETAA